MRFAPIPPVQTLQLPEEGAAPAGDGKVPLQQGLGLQGPGADAGEAGAGDLPLRADGVHKGGLSSAAKFTARSLGSGWGCAALYRLLEFCEKFTPDAYLTDVAKCRTFSVAMKIRSTGYA